MTGGIALQNTSARKTILIVDDITDNIQLLRNILSPHYRVKIATSGEKALMLADAADLPDLILLDVMMPGLDGFEVCRELKRRASTRSVPVIFVTALDDAIDEEQGFAAGAVDYITKPVTPSIVLARVATHLALRQALVDLEQQNSILSENALLREQVERIMRHDLKTPLTAFIGIPALLKKRTDLPADVIESVCMLEKSGMKMLEMINRSLDIYRMETGTYKIKPVPVELIRIINQIGFELSDYLKAKSVCLQVSINGEKIQSSSRFFINSEETLCYSMLANFLKNAVEACSDNDVIRVGFYDRPMMRLTINNPGVIPSDIRDRFMQKFVTHGKLSGTGLGGYSACLMARTMGGAVSFTSDDITGTTIKIDFAQDQAAESSAGGIGHLNVLVVDENEMLLYTVRDILRSVGLHRVESAAGVESASSFLEKERPVQLIIIDWIQDSVSYNDLFRKIRASSLYKNVPVLIIGLAAIIEPSAHEGMVEYICKPFSPDILLKKVEGFIDSMLQLGEKR